VELEMKFGMKFEMKDKEKRSMKLPTKFGL
jgi:hypothetical protein